MPDTLSNPDHDLLIEVRADLKNLNLNVVNSITTANKSINDHEARLRLLETGQEVSRGTLATSKDNKRTLIEVISLIIAAITMLILYQTGHH